MKQLDALMQKEMTRKEFLGAIGLGVVSILGFSSILRFLFGKGQQQQTGYGSSNYSHLKNKLNG